MKILAKYLLIISQILFVNSMAFAKISISKEYGFAPEKIKVIEDSLTKAFEREYKEYPTYFTISDEQSIGLWCPVNQPQQDLTGCSMTFLLELPDNVKINISKDLNLTVFSTDVTNRLSSIDVNSTEEHQHFGNLFGKDEKSASHYFCEPKGEEGQKDWACKLYVQEDL